MKLPQSSYPVFTVQSLGGTLENLEIGTRVIVKDYTTVFEGRHIVDQVGIVVTTGGPINSIELGEAISMGAGSAQAYGVILLGEMGSVRIPNTHCSRLNAKKFKQYLSEHNINEEWANDWCKQIYRMIGK